MPGTPNGEDGTGIANLRDIAFTLRALGILGTSGILGLEIRWGTPNGEDGIGIANFKDIKDILMPFILGIDGISGNDIFLGTLNGEDGIGIDNLKLNVLEMMHLLML